MKTATLLLIVTFGALPCAARSEAVKLTPADAKMIKRGLADIMKDPDSVRVGRTLATTTEGHIVVCGYVNGKNSYGGYTGEQPFYGWLYRKPQEGRPARFTALYLGSDDIKERVLRAECAKQGIPDF